MFPSLLRDLGIKLQTRLCRPLALGFRCPDGLIHCLVVIVRALLVSALLLGMRFWKFLSKQAADVASPHGIRVLRGVEPIFPSRTYPAQVNHTRSVVAPAARRLVDPLARRRGDLCIQRYIPPGHADLFLGLDPIDRHFGI